MSTFNEAFGSPLIFPWYPVIDFLTFCSFIYPFTILYLLLFSWLPVFAFLILSYFILFSFEEFFSFFIVVWSLIFIWLIYIYLHLFSITNIGYAFSFLKCLLLKFFLFEINFVKSFYLPLYIFLSTSHLFCWNSLI